MRVNEVIQDRLQNSEVDKIFSFLRTNCSQYINSRGGLEEALSVPLYRGVHHVNWERSPVQVVDVNLSRSPKDSSIYLHQAADDWFYLNFGIRFRSASLFCVFAEQTASSYGEPVIVFPLGQFDYCWSREYADMYSAFQSAFRDFVRSTGASPSDEAVNEFMSDGKYMHNTGLSDAAGKFRRNEVMVACKQVALINPVWVSDYL